MITIILNYFRDKYYIWKREKLMVERLNRKAKERGEYESIRNGFTDTATK